MSIIKSQNARVMSEEAIQYLCKCINLVNSLPTSVIDNLHLADNLTFSSTKIDRLLTILKEDCNKYTDSIVANLSRLELKVVTDEADMIEHNKLYLIKKAGETSYSQYVIVTNDSGVDEKILLGTCDISMTDYLKITDADSTYCKKTDFDTLKTALTTHTSDTDIHITSAERTKWDKTSTDFTTHTGDTDIHITSNERTKWNEVDNKVNKTDIIDNLTSTDTDKPLSANQGKVLKGEVDLKANKTEVVDKTDITTTINSTSTDTQVPSAKSVYNLAGNENRRGYVYNNPTHRGNTWNRVFKVNSLLYCSSGFLTVTVYSGGLCEIATFLMSKNFNRLNIKQINCGGYNGIDGQGRPIKVRIVGAEHSLASFLEIYVSGTSNTTVMTTYMPLFCNGVVVSNEEGSIPEGMFACEMTATHDTYDSATYTSVLK